MSKTKTLFTMALLVLLGSMGAAQAQNLAYESSLFTTPAAAAREGGEAEMSGWRPGSAFPDAHLMIDARSLSITPSLLQAT